MELLLCQCQSDKVSIFFLKDLFLKKILDLEKLNLHLKYRNKIMKMHYLVIMKVMPQKIINKYLDIQK